MISFEYQIILICTGLFGTQAYRIVTGNVGNAFRLVSHREKDDILYLDLQVNGALDRETIASFTLVIEALDGGQPPLTDQLTVKIVIVSLSLSRFSNLKRKTNFEIIAGSQ